MSNQQIFPASPYPISGDVVSTPGSPEVTVTGIQTYGFSSQAPQESQIPIFTSGQWVPTSATISNNDSISVSGISVSDDYWIFTNFIDTNVQVNSSYSPHGFPILAAGTPVA